MCSLFAEPWYYAALGEVLYHNSHVSAMGPPQPIHSEPNPCPDRHLFVFDWKNLVRQHPVRSESIDMNDVHQHCIAAASVH